MSKIMDEVEGKPRQSSGSSPLTLAQHNVEECIITARRLSWLLYITLLLYDNVQATRLIGSIRSIDR